MAQVKYAGIKINIGGEDMIVPALSVGQAEEYDTQMSDIRKAITDKAAAGEAPFGVFAQWIPIYLVAIQRNYPEMTAERLKSDVDLAGMAQIQRAVLGFEKDSPLTRGE